MQPPVDVLRFKQLDPRAVLPTRGSALAAGLDICCIEDVQLPPKQRAMARTGLAVAIPPGFYGRVAAYEQALAASDDGPLLAALDRNLYGTVVVLDERMAAVARYIRRSVAGLAAQPLESILAGRVQFGPPPVEAGCRGMTQ